MVAFKSAFIWKNIKIIFFIFQKLILTSTHQKWYKNIKKYINLKQR